jgi:hypothetical protein
MYMKLRALLLLCLSSTTLLINAQTFEYPWAFNIDQPGDFVIPRDIDTDADGNSYVLFNFSEPLQIGAIQFDPVGQTDIGVVKVSPDGTTLWGAAAASASADQGNAITVNSSGEVFITGYYTNDIQFDDLVLETNGSTGATEFFVAKINSDGLWAWAKQQTGSAIAAGNAIDSDLQGNIIVGGTFFGEDLLIDQETFTAQEQLPFIFKASPDGEIIWSFHPETPYGASLGGLTVDDAGKVYICGSFGTFEDAEVIFTAGTVVLTNAGDPEESLTAADMYVLALSSEGVPLWGENAGSLYFESFASSIAVDNNGQVYVTGVFQDSISNATTSIDAYGPEGDYDYYLASFSNTGEWLWLKQIGNTDFNTGSVILKSSSEGYIYLTGNLENQPFDFETFSLQLSGVNNSFLNRINADGSYRWGFAHPSIYGFSVYANNSFRITGNFTDPITLGATTLNATGGAGADMYTCRLNYSPLVPDGIIELSAINVDAFPNPFSDQFKLVSDDQILEVRLFDLTGRQVLCDASYFGNSVVVSTNNHASGFLFAEIRTVSAVKTLRLTQVK